MNINFKTVGKAFAGLAVVTTAVLLVLALSGCSQPAVQKDPVLPKEPIGQEEPIQQEEPVVLEGEEKLEALKDIREDYKGLGEDCVLAYASQEDVKDLLEHGTGVVLFTWTGCPWCQKYVEYVNTAAILADADEVLCYDLYEDREAGTDFYKFVVEKLGTALDEAGAYDADGKLRVYVPDVAFVVKGEVVANDNETSMIPEGEGDPETYWDEIEEDGVTKGSKFLDKLSGYFCKVCEGLDEVNHRGCDSCKAVRPENNSEEEATDA